MRHAVFCSLALLLMSVAWAADGPKFEVASVKVAGPDVKPPYSITGGPGTSDPGRFHASRINMSTLLLQAFGVSPDQITGPDRLRDFTGDTYYTVDAAIPPGTTKEQYQEMMQNLLAERFHLVFHIEKKNFPGYDLVVDKDGPKFKEVTPTPGAEPNAGQQSIVFGGPAGADQFPDVKGPRTIGMSNNGVTRTKYQERTMAEFVSNLGFIIGSSQGRGVLDGHLQPRVVDKTGLTGKYTFILKYRDDSMRLIAQRVMNSSAGGAGSENLAALAASDPDASAPGIIAAIQKQLGLRLDKTKDVPLDAIVVDSVDKVPTEN